MVGYIGYQSEYDLGGIEKINNSKNSIVRNGLVLHLDAAKKGFVAGSLVYRWFSTTGPNPTTSQDFNALFVSNLQGQGLHTTGTIDWPEISFKPSYITVSENFAWEVSGALVIEEPGNYVFETRSDDGNQLEINNEIVASFYGARGTPVVGEKTAPIFLSQGYHSFRYRMQQGTGGAGAQVRWQTPSGTSFVVIPQSNLGYFETGASNTGNSWRDLSGNQYNLSIIGSPAYNSNGYFTFANNQISEYMVRNNFENPLQDVTYFCWFRSNFFSSAQTPFTYSVAGNNEMLFYVPSSTQLNPHPKGTSVIVNTSSMQNVWVNFSWTRQTSTGLNIFYRDGVQIGTHTEFAGTAISAGGDLVIGQEVDLAGPGGFDVNQNLDGDFSYLLIYNRVLSNREIQQNFNATRARYGI
jgi:hypothetical protein